MSEKWRLILNNKGDGYYNMAADEAISLNYASFKMPTLRIYGWERPFISLGYNQKIRDILKPGAEIPFIRRITGGSSIFHHNELTYSITCSLQDLSLPREVKKSYEKICGFLIRFYSMLGLGARFAKDIFETANLGQYSDFCFSSCQHYDLIIRRRKIGGNAQRRTKDIIFQHGSIPQLIDVAQVRKAINNTELFEDKITFLDALLNQKTDFKKLQFLLMESFKESFNIKFREKGFYQQEKKTIEYLKENKYRQKEWNLYK
ncbi:MAG: lipoate--protein ligase family protein [Candidatus Omnitrophota bacterium]|nr:MAG: lipoate--protein ligase family protein [Candidatus Omnitrophota bacterium]